MTELDDRITKALEAEDRVLMEQLGEQNFLDQFGGIFRGRTGWVSRTAWAFGMASLLIAFYAAWKFATGDSVISVVHWGGLAWLAFTAEMMIEQWSWARMETNRTTREIKRLELQMARLLEKVSS